jgi:hypothetical protein
MRRRQRHDAQLGHTGPVEITKIQKVSALLPLALRLAVARISIAAGPPAFREEAGMKPRLIELIGTVCLAGAATMAGAATLPTDPGNEPTELYARSAAYYDPARAGEGIVVQLLSQGRAVVYLFSYVAAETAAGSPGQSWMIGVGQQVAGGILVNELQRPTGGRFGPDFDPNEVVYNSFGPLTFEYPTCGTSANRGTLNVSPDASAGFGALLSGNYVQLSQLADCSTGESAPYAYFSGSWYDPLHVGEGLVLQVVKDGRAVVLWFTYDGAGKQLWIEGVGQLENSILTVDELNSYSGALWGPSFNSLDVAASPFGKLTVEFYGCDTGTMHYETSNFGSGTFHLERLTELMGISDSGRGCWDY